MPNPSPEVPPSPSSEDADITGTCPHCATEVPYENWIEVQGEPGRMGCPHCRLSCLVDDVFRPA